MDSSNQTLAWEQGTWENHASYAAKTGRLPWLSACPQATKGTREVSAWDQLQHPSDQTPPQQPSSVYAFWRENDLGKKHLTFNPLPQLSWNWKIVSDVYRINSIHFSFFTFCFPSLPQANCKDLIFSQLHTELQSRTSCLYLDTLLKLFFLLVASWLKSINLKLVENQTGNTFCMWSNTMFSPWELINTSGFHTLRQ